MNKMLAGIIALAGALACLCLFASQDLVSRQDSTMDKASPNGHSATSEQRVWKLRSCRKCLSVQTRNKSQSSEPNEDQSSNSDGSLWTWKYQARAYTSCQHEWKEGMSSSAGKVVNGQLVLLKKNDTYGGFIFTSQLASKLRLGFRRGLPMIYKDKSQHRASFVWRLGADDNGSFDTGDRQVEWSDKPRPVRNRGGEWMIEFGPFALEWSRNTDDTGWIYYTKSAIHELDEDDLAICVTNLRSFEEVNPRDTKWQYRRSPVDGL